MSVDRDLLNRNDAPFGEILWNFIDEIVTAEVSKIVSVRKLIHTQGPLGLGVRFVGTNEERIIEESMGSQLSVRIPVTLALLSDSFSFAASDIDEYIRIGAPIDLTSLVRAAHACAKLEDSWLLNGSEKKGIKGLVNSDGVQVVSMKPWEQPGDAIESIIKAVSLLDKEGFHGPYSLALSPVLYNKLFRSFPQSDLLEFDAIKNIVTAGIIKAPALKSGGILVDSDKLYSSIIIGQDMIAGFEGPHGRNYQFSLSETIGLRLPFPHSICVLQGE